MAEGCSLRRYESGEVLIPRLELAVTFWRRFAGLQFRRGPAADQAVLFSPCHSIHTHWMRFAIDVVLVDATGVVLEVRAAVAPWRLVRGPRGTRVVIESAANVLANRVASGDRLAVSCGAKDAGFSFESADSRERIR